MYIDFRSFRYCLVQSQWKDHQGNSSRWQCIMAYTSTTLIGIMRAGEGRLSSHNPEGGSENVAAAAIWSPNPQIVLIYHMGAQSPLWEWGKQLLKMLEHLVNWQSHSWVMLNHLSHNRLEEFEIMGLLQRAVVKIISNPHILQWWRYVCSWSVHG